MFERIKGAIIPNLFGIIIMVAGWFISILNIGWNARGYQAPILFTKWTGIGLLVILFGAYLPDVWMGIREKLSK